MMFRDGDKVTIKADELTVGDIVEIKFGDRVPADIRVLEARSFKVIPVPTFLSSACFLIREFFYSKNIHYDNII